MRLAERPSRPRAPRPARADHGGGPPRGRRRGGPGLPRQAPAAAEFSSARPAAGRVGPPGRIVAKAHRARPRPSAPSRARGSARPGPATTCRIPTCPPRPAASCVCEPLEQLVHLLVPAEEDHRLLALERAKARVGQSIAIAVAGVHDAGSGGRRAGGTARAGLLGEPVAAVDLMGPGHFQPAGRLVRRRRLAQAEALSGTSRCGLDLLDVIVPLAVRPDRVVAVDDEEAVAVDRKYSRAARTFSGAPFQTGSWAATPLLFEQYVPVARPARDPRTRADEDVLIAGGHGRDRLGRPELLHDRLDDEGLELGEARRRPRFPPRAGDDARPGSRATSCPAHAGATGGSEFPPPGRPRAVPPRSRAPSRRASCRGTHPGAARTRRTASGLPPHAGRTRPLREGRASRGASGIRPARGEPGAVRAPPPGRRSPRRGRRPGGRRSRAWPGGTGPGSPMEFPCAS